MRGVEWRSASTSYNPGARSSRNAIALRAKSWDVPLWSDRVFRMNTLAGAQLSAITEVLKAANELGIEAWLRGGWAMDFYLGQITREHEDVDWFVWDKDLPTISTLLTSRGWIDLAIQPLDQQRDLLRDGVELGFAPLIRAEAGRVVVGGGPYRGEPWPEDMINNAAAGELEGIRCPIISPAAQIEIKRMMPIWAPGFRRRDKDSRDIATLEAALRIRQDQAGTKH